jgi:uncharacterized protein YbjT (DUF2867 family)
VWGVYSVQNGMASGFEREVAQGRSVAGAAATSGIGHLVYGSAGPGTSTGVPSWDSKLVVEDYIRGAGLTFTILRPLAFMELMTDPGFYPAFGTWRIWPRLTGEGRPIPWLAVEDLGAIAARVFAEPGRFAGREITLTSDTRSLAECRSLYREAMGRDPRSLPMPTWLFDRFTRKDAIKMWRWLRTGEVPLSTAETRGILPSALTVPEWLRGQAGPGIAGGG